MAKSTLPSSLFWSSLLFLPSQWQQWRMQLLLNNMHPLARRQEKKKHHTCCHVVRVLHFWKPRAFHSSHISLSKNWPKWEQLEYYVCMEKNFLMYRHRSGKWSALYTNHLHKHRVHRIIIVSVSSHKSALNINRTAVLYKQTVKPSVFYFATSGSIRWC